MVHLSEAGAELGQTVGAAALGSWEGARQVVEDRLAEGGLDGALAAYFLHRHRGEDRNGQLVDRLAGAAEGFTRWGVAMLGVAVERGWLPAEPETVEALASGLARLARQGPGTEVDYRESIKLLWGASLGAGSPAVRASHPELVRHFVGALRDYRRRAEGRPRDYVLASAVLADIDQSDRLTLARELAYLLLRVGPDLAPTDAAAALWAVSSRCFAPSPVDVAGLEGDLTDLRRRLLPRLLRPVQVEDVLDALLLDAAYSDLAGSISGGRPTDQDALSVALRAVDGFPEVARRLRERGHGRPPLLVENEYDVQDLLYVALKPHVLDLSDEEWTPKDAGRAKRIDFVSASARLCVEAKMPRDRAHGREIADELKVDVESYYVHDACDTLLVFVYDPEGHMADAAQQERQLSGTRTIKGRTVEVLVRIRPR